MITNETHPHPNLVVRVAHLADAVRDRVHDLDLQKVRWGRVRFVQRLTLGHETLRGRATHSERTGKITKSINMNENALNGLNNKELTR